MSIQSFFNKISQVSVPELLDFLAHNQSEITLKIKDQYIKTNVTTLKEGKYFTLLKFTDYSFSNEPVTCSFQVKEDRYFFKTFLNSQNIGTTMSVPENIFHLQRRNDYRVSMPVGVFYVCEIRFVNDKKTKYKAEIRDISLGGCQFSIKEKDVIKTDDIFDIYFKIDRFEFTSLKLIAKHIKTIESADGLSSYSLIGSSFSVLDNQIISEMQSMLMFLDRIHRRKSDDL